MKRYLKNFILIGNEQTQLEQFRFLLANVFVFFLPYDKIYSTLVLMLLIVSVLFDFNLKKVKNIPKQFWIFQMVIFISIAGYFYSDNKTEAYQLIERQLTFLIFPIILPLAFQITKERIKVILQTVLISSLVCILLLFCNIFYVISSLKLPFSSILTSPFLNQNFSGFINAHASYLSIYVSLAFIYYFYQFLKTERKTELKIIKFIIIGFILLSGLIFLAAKIIIFYLILLFLIAFPFTLVKNKVKYFSVLLVLLSLFSILIFNNNDLKNRYIYTATKDLELQQGDINSFEVELIESRSQRWKLGFGLVKDAPIIGNGTGDERDLMQQKYKENLLVVSYIKRFNVHNQYLSVLIKHGSIGLLIFIFAFTYYLQLALRHKDYMYLFFMLGILAFFTVENVLDTNKGIFYFAFFNTLFGYKHLMNSKKLTL